MPKSKNGYQIRNPHGQKPLSTGFIDFQNLPIFTDKFAGRVNWNSAQASFLFSQVKNFKFSIGPPKQFSGYAPCRLNSEILCFTVQRVEPSGQTQAPSMQEPPLKQGLSKL